MAHGKQFTLFSHARAPNGWKVAIVLEELGLTYETIFLDFQKDEQKAESHTKHNPNGRIPTLIDHKNNDFTLWESCAILEYLVQTYDPEGKVSVKEPGEKFKQLQWLFFQSSGQGPYFGQAAWFKNYHPEKVPSAVERYQNEIKRVISVLEAVLSKQQWLVGRKPTVADISFIPYHIFAISGILGDYDITKEAPAVDKWMGALRSRPAVAKIWQAREEKAKQEPQ